MRKQREKSEKPILTDLLKGGSGHDGYTYQADTYCVPCGQTIISDLYADGDYDEGESGDSDTHPQPIFFGKSPDYPQHCAQCVEYLYGGPENELDEDDEE